MNKTLKNYPFASALSKHMQAFIEEKRSCGYSYNPEALTLYRLDQCIRANKLDCGEINQAVIEIWCRQLPTECNNTRYKRVLVLQGFLNYLRGIGISVPPLPLFRKQPPKLRNIPTKEELQGFFEFVDNFKPQGHNFSIYKLIRSSVVFRLYYCTGMRLSEAACLRWKDLDFDNGHLLICESKGDKHRIIYLHQQLLELMMRYQHKLKDLDLLNEWLFPSVRKENNHLYSKIITRDFKELWKKFRGGKKEDPAVRPTVHSLRHSFILTRLATWTEEGVDIKVMLPYLSAHLGHKSVTETYYYIQGLSHLVPAVKHFMETNDALSEELYRYE